MKYLIFRNDRVGDFLITAPLIKAIKTEDINSEIYIVCSNKNVEFIKEIDYIDGFFLFNKRNLLDRIKFLTLLRKKKFDRVIVSDKKNRSIIFSFFVKSKEKIFNVSKKFQYILIKLFYNNVFLDNDNVKEGTYEILERNAKCFGFKMQKDDKFLPKNIKTENNFLNFFDKSKDKILLHLDEKWHTEEYSIAYKQANTLTRISLKAEEILNFAEIMYTKNNYEIIISTGTIKTSIFEELKKISEPVKDNLYRIKISNGFIYLINNLNLFEMIELISKSKVLISCHGAFTHVAFNYGLYIYDIIEEKKLSHYNRITKHMRHYEYIFRKNFASISKEIINKI